MENVNIGIINLVVSSELKGSYFKNEMVTESKEKINEFFDVVKSSPLLQLEFKVFNNIEGKHIVNEVIAKDYIDNKDNTTTIIDADGFTEGIEMNSSTKRLISIPD